MKINKRKTCANDISVFDELFKLINVNKGAKYIFPEPITVCAYIQETSGGVLVINPNNIHSFDLKISN